MNTSRGSWLTGLSLNTGWFTPGSLAMSRLPTRLLLRLVLRVLRRPRCAASACRSMPWSLRARVLQAAALELLEQVGDALVAVAAVRVAGVGEKADQRLVELHALGLLGPVGRDRALGTLRRDRARARWSAAGRPASGRRTGRPRRACGRAAPRRRARPGSGVPSICRLRDAAEACRPRAARPRPRRRSACRTAAATTGSSRAVSARDALARQRPPGQRGRDRGQHRGLGRMARQALQPAQEHRARAARLARRRSAPRRARRGASVVELGLVRRHRPVPMSKSSLSEAPNSVPSPAAWKRSIMNLSAARAASLALRPDDGRRRRQHRVGRIAGLAAGLRRRQLGPPCRLT